MNTPNLGLKHISFFLFYIGLVLVPFNQIDGLDLLREYAQESAIYSWLIGGVLLLMVDFFLKKKIVFPFKSEIVLFWSLFFGWCIITYFLNFETIQSNYFKFRSGNNRFVFQMISLFISSYFLISFFYNIFRQINIKRLFLKIRRILFYTFVFVFIYGLIELCVGCFNSNLARSIINFLNYLPVLDKTDYIDGRLAAVSFEVPALGNYFIFMYGWMFSYAFTENTWYKKFLPSIFLILFTVLSGARAALIIVLFQVLLGSIFFLKVKKIRINYKLKYGALIALFLIILSNWNKLETIFSQKLNLFDVEHSISNKTRYGMQYASLMVFKDEPITGVGFGQNGFHKQRYYPDWALKNNYEFTDWYLDENVYSFAPDFNLYTRLLAETGLIGVFLFVCFLCIVLKNTLSMLCSTSNEVVIFGVILFLSFVGFIINWLQIDHFRQFGFWVCISLLIWLKNENSLGKA